MNRISGPETKTRRQLVAAALVSGLVVAAGAWWVGSGPVEPETVEGWASPNASGSAIGFAESPTASSHEGYIVAGAWWMGPEGSIHQGDYVPTCIGTDTAVKTHVELGIVEVRTEEGVGWKQVVWLRCL
jgi:hypothetical protein